MSESRTTRLGSALRRHWVAATAATAAVVLVGGGATAALAAPATPAATTASHAACTTPGVGRLLRALPDSLQTDLKTLRKDSKAAKPAERAAIRKKALAGEYGVRIGRVAQISAGKGAKLHSAIPAALKADLKTLHHDAKGSARAAEAATIWKKAVAGSYGSTWERLAKDAQAKIATHCSAAES